MSIQRLNMLKNGLVQKGWTILNETGPKYDQGIYEVKEQKLYWWLRNVDTKIEPIEIHFFIFDGLGRRTEDLNDLAFCMKAGNKPELFFSKIKSKAWEIEHAQFIDSLTKA
ncbi:MAG: hypothetical protein ACJASQ_004308 [Crocinitomicaceae bacterium]|jgi:hypothetical protein